MRLLDYELKRQVEESRCETQRSGHVRPVCWAGGALGKLSHGFPSSSDEEVWPPCLDKSRKATSMARYLQLKTAKLSLTILPAQGVCDPRVVMG